MDSGLRLRSVLVPRVALVLLLALLAVGTASALVWNITTVDSDRYMITPSLALDGAGDARIAYWHGGSLTYAAWNGTAWTKETVASAGSIDSDLSLALDAAGNPRIAYIDGDTNDLKYAARTGYVWSIQTVDSSSIAGTPSLALDGAGNPRIAYYDFASQDLKYAALSGSSWSIQTVDSTGDVGRQPSLVLGSGGSPRIAYVDLTGGRIRYAAWTGTAWAFESVGSISSTVTTPLDGPHPSLALDSALNPSVAYYDYRTAT